MRLKLFLLTGLMIFSSAHLSAQQPRLVLPIGHTQLVSSVTFSSDGRKVLTASHDNTAKIWDAGNGNLLADLKGHTDAVFSGLFSPDEKKIITASWDSTCKIWDATSLQLLTSIKHNAGVRYATFSPKGKIFATVLKDNTVRIWDANSYQFISELKDVNWTSAISFSPDGEKIAMQSVDGYAKIWNANNGNILIDFKNSTDQFKSITFSTDGNKILGNCYGDKIKVWNAATGELLLDMKAHERTNNMDEIMSAALSPNGKYILAVTFDEVRIWDADSGILRTVLREEVKHVPGTSFQNQGNSFTIAAFSPDGTNVVTGSFKGSASIWDASTGKQISILKSITSAVKFITYSSDGKRIAIGSDYDPLKIWNSYNGNLIVELKSHSKQGKTSSFSHVKNKYVMTYSDIREYNNLASNEQLNTDDLNAKIWDTRTGQLMWNLEGHTKKILSATFSSDANRVFTEANDDTVRIWDAHSGVLLIKVPGQLYDLSALISPDEKKIITSSWDDKQINIWDANNGNLNFVINGEKETSVVFSPDGKIFVTATVDSMAKMRDSQTGAELLDLKANAQASTISPHMFSADSRRVVIIPYYGSAKIWDIKKKQLLFVLEDADTRMNPLELAEITPDSKRIITISYKYVKIWDAKNGRPISTIKVENANLTRFSYNNKIIIITYDNNSGTTSKIYDMVSGRVLNVISDLMWALSPVISPDGKYFVSASLNNTAMIWDGVTGRFLKELKGHTGNILFETFTPDGKMIVTISADNTTKFWDIVTGNLLYTSVALDNTDYINLLENGFYQASNAAAKLLHYVTKDLKVISFEQLDVKYNRPDKLLEAMGNTDTALIKSYRKAWEKRIKKLGIDTTAFRDGYSVPEADFVNRDMIEYEQKNKKLTLRIQGTDSTYKLDRFNVWINEVPAYGQRGIRIRKRNKNDFDTTITIHLSQGENRVETSITNVNGTESYRIPLTVNYTPTVRQKEITHFIGIGIDKFADSQYNLQYSAKDIRDLSIKLKDRYGDSIVIDTLFNENVTINNVKALKQKLRQTTENDKVIIAYSGHGILSKEYDYYLSTYSVNFEKPEQNGLPYDELENLLDSIPARKKLMLIDACHSGEVDKEDLTRLNENPDSLIKGFKPVAYKKEGQIGLKNSFELMQSLFVNVGKSTGATIISAAAGTQFALERNDLKNGVFTYSILEAMNKYPSIKISELKQVVSQRVVELTKGLQRPTSRNETIAVDWNLW